MTDVDVLFHARGHAAAALGMAGEQDIRLTLITTPDAARFAGPTYLAGALTRAKAAHPGAQARAWIDCGGDAGLVLRAIKAGWRHVVFTGHETVMGRVQDICDQQGVEIRSHKDMGGHAIGAFVPADTPDVSPGMRDYFMARRDASEGGTGKKARMQS